MYGQGKVGEVSEEGWGDRTREKEVVSSEEAWRPETWTTRETVDEGSSISGRRLSGRTEGVVFLRGRVVTEVQSSGRSRGRIEKSGGVEKVHEEVPGREDDFASTALVLVQRKQVPTSRL